MEKYMSVYQQWLDANIDEDTRKELESIKGNELEIKDRFYQMINFGTAGLRNKLEAGTNRINKYTVAVATQALANVIKEHGEEYVKKGVAYAYDCRIMSPEFSLLASLIMASNGIKAYLFESLRATPELSYTIRHFGCASGVVVTASHNPKNYNGYKVYWEEGSQIKDNIANRVYEEMHNLDMFKDYVTITKEEAIEKGLLVMLGEELDEKFYAEAFATSLRGDDEVDKNINIVYTPLNGAGNVAVRTVLDRMGYKNTYVVKEQEAPDGTFPTLVYPNPEDLKAFEYSEKLAYEVGADVLLATDPDSDRLAVEVMHEGKVRSLNGNQVGVLLINYIITSMVEKNKLPKNPVMVKSIVTGEMGTAVANRYGVEMLSVLTGFKNISAMANEYDITKEKNYIFGYEESIGYNIGTFVRDKDGVSIAMIVAEMVGYYKKKGMTLIDVLNSLFEEYGYYQENTTAIVLEGIEGKERIGRMMKEFRNIYPKNIGNAKIIEVTDYLKQEKQNMITNEVNKIDIEKTDAVRFLYDDGSWFTLRPSGTEPKIKVYIYVKGSNMEEARLKLKEYEDKALEIVYTIE